MKNIWNFVLRHIAWLLPGSAAIILSGAGFAEFKTLLLIVVTESLALALSGLALFAYTKIDFTKNISNGGRTSNFGIYVISSIFVGVHILVGLVVLGVYIAQFAG